MSGASRLNPQFTTLLSITTNPFVSCLKDLQPEAW